MGKSNATAGLLTIANQELNVLLSKMKVEFDTLISLYRLDVTGIKLLKKAQRSWEQYVEDELKLVEYDWIIGTICPLQVNARKQELVIARTMEFKKIIENKRNKELEDDLG